MTVSRVVVFPRKMIRVTKDCLLSSSRIVMFTTGSALILADAFGALAAGAVAAGAAAGAGGPTSPGTAAAGGAAGTVGSFGAFGSFGKAYSGTPVNSK